ncbi:MAG: chemotaxis protein CheW [Armatimonadota bacterium]
MANTDQNTIEDGELYAIFLEEAREQIENLDQGLVNLEREPHNHELIHGIFRAAHTLKGSSGAMGLRQMANLTHAMEDVLDCIREGKLTVTATIADHLLQGLDLLRAMEKDLEEGRGDRLTSEEVPPIAATLRAVAHGDFAAAPHPTEPAPPKAKKTRKGAAMAKETAVESLQPAPAQAPALAALPDTQVGILVNFTEDCQMPGIRAVMVLRQLATMGQVLTVTPTEEEIDRGMIGHRLLFTLQTDATEELVRQQIRKVAEVEWARVARGGAAAGMRLDMPAREDLRKDDASDERKFSGAIQTQQTVRVSVDVLDRIMNLVGELVLDRTRVAQLKNELPEQHRSEEFIRDLDAVSQHLGSIVEELHEQIMQARMLPVSQLFNRFPRMVRDISRQLGKEVNFIIEGENEFLDRSIIEKLVDPLTHILRNAVDHGLESPAERAALEKNPCGSVRLSAQRKEEHISIEVSDDGPGINVERLKEKATASGLLNPERAQTMTDQEAYCLIFASGLSTAKQVSDVSGRGVGMDVVKRNIDAINGSILVESTPSMGTKMTIKIPLTLAIVRALIVRVGQVSMAVPLSHIEESLESTGAQRHSVRGYSVLQWRNTVVPIIHLADALPGCGESQSRDQLVIVRYDNRVVGLAVDEIVGHQEIVVKPLGNYLGEVPGLAGATILGNGRVALILDIGKLFESGFLQQTAHHALEQAQLTPAVKEPKARRASEQSTA